MSRKAINSLDQKTASTIGKSLKSYRKASGISRETLARSADISLGALQVIEKGSANNVTLQTLIALSKATSIPIGKMIGHQ